MRQRLGNLSPSDVRQLLDYSAETGHLTWKFRHKEWFADGQKTAIHLMNSWNSRFSGKRALNAINSSGYLGGVILNQRVVAHRVVWAIAFGCWPDKIDHINGDRTDNRLGNLRSVSVIENAHNKRIPRSNTSGAIGVGYCRITQKWFARIQCNGKRFELGRFHSREEAIVARAKASADFGFHPNHGRAA